MAQLTTLPRTILEKARELAEKLRADTQKQQTSSQMDEIMKKKKWLIWLTEFYIF